ncbi:MAG: (deoxy)nucleoside triphosphate pyrophosphohydrolase [Desulfovibrionaceae bacterium]
MHRIEVVAAILWRGPCYLAVQRPPGKVQAGWWEFPGGKIEEGESAETALIRELQEELGIEARAPHLWKSLQHTYAATAQDKARCVHVHFFQVTDFAGEPQNREGQNMRWVSPQEALKLPFLAADIAIVHEMCAAASLSQTCA